MGVIHFLNVKDGDCAIIQHLSGRVSMIDICNGNAEAGAALDERMTILEGLKGNRNQKAYPVNPLNYLSDIGVTSIFRFILTHPDMDHMDGIKQLFTRFSVNCFWDTANNKIMEESGFGSFKKEDWEFYQKRRKGKNVLNVYDGSINKYYNRDDNGGRGDFLYVLAPTPALVRDANTHKNYNNCSYVVLYHECGRKILFCGDAEEKEWNVLLKKYGSLLTDIDVLFAPHHGRKTGGNDCFLDILKPKLTLFGNAKSKYLNYTDWNNRGLLHFTNNEGGNFVLLNQDGVIYVYCSNKSFAEDFTTSQGYTSTYNESFKAWYLGYL